jgi:hypothetical protein
LVSKKYLILRILDKKGKKEKIMSNQKIFHWYFHYKQNDIKRTILKVSPMAQVGVAQTKLRQGILTPHTHYYNLITYIVQFTLP